MCRRVYNSNPMRRITWQRIRKAIKDPKIIGVYLLCKFAFLFPDKLYLTLLYRARFGRKINWDSPQTYNEKIQWLKLYDRNPEYVKMVDKYAVKQYISQLIGPQHVIPLLGVWDSPDEIDFDNLPNQFVLKCNHDSGKVIICKDKKELDVNFTKKELKKALKCNFYRKTREWPYKNVPRKIIAEEYMVDESGYELKDYKFFCFDGVPRCFKIDFGRFTEHHANYYDINGTLLPFGEQEVPSVPREKLPMPRALPKMIEVAKELSQRIPFVRVDLYEIKGNVYFGELTFYPAGGLGKITPAEWDYKLGELIHLPR